MKMDDEAFDDVWDLREGGDVMLLRRVIELGGIIVYTILTVVTYSQREVDVVVDVNFFSCPECEHGRIDTEVIRFFISFVGIRIQLFR